LINKREKGGLREELKTAFIFAVRHADGVERRKPQ